MSQLRCRPGVEDDLLEQAAFIAERSPRAAERFVTAAQRTLKDLAKAPGVGSLKEFKARELARVRTWPVKGFPKHLIYYIPLPDGIDVLAIMHGAREPRAKLRERTKPR